MKLKMQIGIAGAAVTLMGAIALSSCTKKYVCKCELTNGSSSVTTQTYDLGKKKHSDAKAECDAKEASVGGLVYSCTLQ